MDRLLVKIVFTTLLGILVISAYSFKKDNKLAEIISQQGHKLTAHKTDPVCHYGLTYDRICCHKSCGVCGGYGCGGRPGGRKNCCIFNIATSRRKCSGRVAPCVMGIEAAKQAEMSLLRFMRNSQRKVVKKSKKRLKVTKKKSKSQKQISQKVTKENISSYIPLVMDKGQPRPLYMNYAVQEDYVPIIGYHKIGGPPSYIRTTVERFNKQVEYFTNVVRCNWITMEILSGYIKRKEKLPTRACVITFDDGIANQYHNTLCTLNKYKIPATFYLPTDLIGSKKYYMTWKEVEELNLIGHDIEAHTLTHAHLAKMSTSQQKREIIGCKKQLEEKGYSVKTFAYPYGEYNSDTISILKDSDYILARDTRVDGTWREPKAITVSPDDSHLFHFFYIRPEYENAKQLWNRVKYTGWMQFEDNYVITKGCNVTVTVKIGRHDFSYGFLNMSSNTEVSSQFLTKYSGGFTLYLIASKTSTTKTPSFEVKVDGIRYEVYASRMAFMISSTKYYKYYINIKRLSPGIHSLSITNVAVGELLLDRFRLFSNVRQEFSHHTYYKTCDPKKDDYCQCKQS